MTCARAPLPAGIKVALPAESASGATFLGLYIRSILALQARAAAPKPLPLAIMTSDDTHARTLELLRANKYFGMREDQVGYVRRRRAVHGCRGLPNCMHGPALSRTGLLVGPVTHPKAFPLVMP